MEEFKQFVQKFTPYLEDIRKRLYATALIFVVAFVAGFLSTGWILRQFIHFFQLKDVVIATTSPFQFADLSIDIGLFCGLLISFPVIVYNVFSFLKPALSKRERGIFFSFVPVSLVLFVAGFSYGFAIMYYALTILAAVNVRVGIENIWDIGMFLSQIILTSALLGALFQFPIVISYVVKLGILDIEAIKGKRRLAYFIIFIFTTLLPPTDGLSLIAMALPLILLYEATIFVNSRSRKMVKL